MFFLLSTCLLYMLSLFWSNMLAFRLSLLVSLFASFSFSLSTNIGLLYPDIVGS